MIGFLITDCKADLAVIQDKPMQSSFEKTNLQNKISPDKQTDLINSSLNKYSKIEYRKSGYSFYGCKYQTLQIFGIDPINNQERSTYVDLYLRDDIELSLDKKIKFTGPFVILVPPTGGVNILDRGYANELCSQNISVALVKNWDFQDEISLDFNMHNNGALRAISAIHQVNNFLIDHSASSIGIMGTSVGAISSSLSMAFENNIKAAVFIAGAVDFPNIIARSDEQGANSIREKRMQNLDLKSQEEYQSQVQKNVWINPKDFIQTWKHKPSFVILAEKDTTVPTDLQLEFAKELDNKNLLSIRKNHVDAIKESFFWHRKAVVEFFKRNL